MNTCDKCKWWKKKYDYDDEGNIILSESDNCMICSNRLKLYCDIEGDDTCGCEAYTEHLSGLMKTGPKFGCVHFEQQENK